MPFIHRGEESESTASPESDFFRSEMQSHGRIAVDILCCARLHFDSTPQTNQFNRSQSAGVDFPAFRRIEINYKTQNENSSRQTVFRICLGTHSSKVQKMTLKADAARRRGRFSRLSAS